MAFNFKSARPKKEKFTRKSSGKPRGQSFLFKFRPALSFAGQALAEKEGKEFSPVVTHEFKMCNAYMEKLDIQNKSVAVLIDEEVDDNGVVTGVNGVALAITPEGHSQANTFLSKGEEYTKSAGFTHENLMKALGEVGTIKLPEVDADSAPLDEEDALLNENQFLDLELVAEVADIDPKNEDDFMREVEEGEGIAIYEVIQGEEIKVAETEDEEVVIEE